MHLLHFPKREAILLLEIFPSLSKQRNNFIVPNTIAFVELVGAIILINKEATRPYTHARRMGDDIDCISTEGEQLHRAL
jgi:hypothetical protein